MQAQQTGCQALRTLGEAADGLQQADTDQVHTFVHLAACCQQVHPIATLKLYCCSAGYSAWCPLQVQKEALDAVAQSMLAFPQDSSLQNHGVAAMLALSGCNMRSVARGVYDVNSTDKQGCTVLHK